MVSPAANFSSEKSSSFSALNFEESRWWKFAEGGMKNSYTQILDQLAFTPSANAPSEKSPSVSALNFEESR
jgi:hypothetical protein